MVSALTAMPYLAPNGALRADVVHRGLPYDRLQSLGLGSPARNNHLRQPDSLNPLGAMGPDSSALLATTAYVPEFLHG